MEEQRREHHAEHLSQDLRAHGPAEGLEAAEHSHHEHPHESTQAVLNRLSRAIGHLEAVRQMVQDGRDCTEVLIQLAAVRSALTNTGKVILKDHIDHCIVDAVEQGDLRAIADLEKAIDQFMK